MDVQGTKALVGWPLGMGIGVCFSGQERMDVRGTALLIVNLLDILCIIRSYIASVC